MQIQLKVILPDARKQLIIGQWVPTYFKLYHQFNGKTQELLKISLETFQKELQEISMKL